MPKRATNDPINTLTLGYGSIGNAYENFDIGRRTGPNNELGVRLNLGYRDGPTAVTGARDQAADVALGLGCHAGGRIFGQATSVFVALCELHRGSDTGAHSTTHRAKCDECVSADDFEANGGGREAKYNGLGATLALFNITQASGFTDPVTNTFGVNGQQRNRGIEVTAFGEPVHGLRVLGGVDFIDGTLTQTAAGTLNGKTAPGVPPYQLNLGGELDIPHASGLTATARVIATGKQYYDQANTQSIPGWARLDLGARYLLAVRDTAVPVRFSVENVTGANYWQSTGRGFLTLGAPRTYLLSTSVSF